MKFSVMKEFCGCVITDSSQNPTMMREKERPAGNQGKVINHFSKYLRDGGVCKKLSL